MLWNEALLLCLAWSAARLSVRLYWSLLHGFEALRRGRRQTVDSAQQRIAVLRLTVVAHTPLVLCLDLWDTQVVHQALPCCCSCDSPAAPFFSLLSLVQYDILRSPVLITESYQERAGSRQALQNSSVISCCKACCRSTVYRPVVEAGGAWVCR